MSVSLQEQADGQVLHVSVSGKLTKEDYEQFVPVIERRIAEHGKVRILVRMHDFHGWDAAALWDDLRFDLRHFRDIERLAIVGEKAWEHGMAVFCKPFTTAEIRYFEQDQEGEAQAWLCG